MIPIARKAWSLCCRSIAPLSSTMSGGSWLSSPSALDNTSDSKSSTDNSTLLFQPAANHRCSATPFGAVRNGTVRMLAVRRKAWAPSLCSIPPWSSALGGSAWLSTRRALRHQIAASYSAAMCHTKATEGSSRSRSSSHQGSHGREDRWAPPQSSGRQGSAGGKTPGWGGRGHSAGGGRGLQGGKSSCSSSGWDKGRVAASIGRTEAIKATHSPQQLLLVVQQQGSKFNHINLSAAYTRAAKLCQQDVAPQQQPAAVQQLLLQLHQLAVRLQQQCEARQLANIIHSCSKLSSPHTAKLLLPGFLQDSTLQQADPQNMSSVVWAAATLQLQLTAAELQQLLRRFEAVHMDPQAVSITLWAVATMGQQVPPLQLQQLLGRFEPVLQYATPQAVSNTLWAVATMGQQVPPQQLQQLLGRLAAQLADVTPQDVSNILWAVATMGQQVPLQQLQPMLVAFDKLLPAATPQNVSNLLWACGKLQYLPLPLLQSLQQQHLQQLLATAVSQNLANIACACGQLGYRGQLLPGALLQQAVKLLQDGGTGSFTSQGLCNLCWSAAVLDLQQCVPQVLQLAAAASCSRSFSTASDEDLQQLHQVHLWLLVSQLPAPGQGLLGVLTQQQLDQCRTSWEESLAAKAKQQSSRLQQSVYAAVLQLPHDTWQQQPRSEQPTGDKACVIDIAAVTASGVKVAIEVEGPYHYVQPDNTLSGPTQARNRALAARGYAVVSIPYWEWDALHGSAQQQKYLLAKLQAVQQQQPDVAAAPQPPAAAVGGELELANASSPRRRRRPFGVDPGDAQGV